jgi:hypothetical protein
VTVCEMGGYSPGAGGRTSSSTPWHPPGSPRAAHSPHAEHGVRGKKGARRSLGNDAASEMMSRHNKGHVESQLRGAVTGGGGVSAAVPLSYVGLDPADQPVDVAPVVAHHNGRLLACTQAQHMPGNKLHGGGRRGKRSGNWQ